jgi:hypothetical protein
MMGYDVFKAVVAAFTNDLIMARKRVRQQGHAELVSAPLMQSSPPV